ncbi:hypothetical protein [Pseudomonas sp. NFX98]|uniref:hypothetical protein n=1 Tax=Pseudomonas sp. NFX98 TaxID=3399122 RepID=UPI0039FB9009
MDSFRQESFVDTGLLSVLSSSLESQMKCDTLYSLLASRLMASSKFPNAGRFSQWHRTFAQALERNAWTLRGEQVLRPTFEGQASVTLSDVIIQAMAGPSLREQSALVLDALSAFSKIPTYSPPAVRFRERCVSQRMVKVPGKEEEQRFTVHVLFAVSSRNACMDLFHLEFETTQAVEEPFLQLAFLTRSFTSPVSVKHHAFEMAARAFARSREQIITFVRWHQMIAVTPDIEPGQDYVTCGAVMAPNTLSLR